MFRFRFLTSSIVVHIHSLSMTQEQFSCFLTQYLASPAGQKEFFARTVFAAFDQDGNGELDEAELDQFLA